MGMGKYGYSGESVALIPGARGHEHSCVGPPELSVAIHQSPANEDTAPMTKWP